MNEIIRRARREDAFAVAALRLQMDLEAGCENRPGFLTEFADYFLAHFDQLPTWIANTSDGAAVGMVQTALVPRIPTLKRGPSPLLYIATVFVTPSHRRQGLAERMLRRVQAWADESGCKRLMLTTRPQAASLYTRVGFTAPDERHLHMEAPFT